VVDKVETRQQLLDQLRKERADWEALLADIGEARMTEPGPMGQWTFKDLIAHVVAWGERDLARLDAAMNGQPVAPAPWPAGLDTDATINAWIYERNKDRPLPDILQDSNKTWQRFEDAVQKLPERSLVEPGYFEWMDGNALSVVVHSFFEHIHEEHEPSIRSWLAGK
jgi:hypothetical protein